MQPFVSGRDIFISLLTRHGKKFCNSYLPIVFKCLRDKTFSIIIVVAPAGCHNESLRERVYQSCTLLWEDLRCSRCAVQPHLHQSRAATDEMVLERNAAFRDIPNMVVFVVDEAHCVKKW